MSESPPLDWSKVHFPVTCARCGHDLFGQSEPACPACKLEFDWSEAVPLDKLKCSQCTYPLMGLTRDQCPECGQPFTWDEALATHHRSKYPLFEHQWRKQFFRSWLISWWWSLRPGSLWRHTSVHENISSRSLWLLVLATVALFVVVEFAIIMGYMLIVGTRSPAMNQFQLAYKLSVALWPPLAAFQFTGLMSLLVYQQSLNKIGVKNVHLLRIWCYSVLHLFLTCWLIYLLVDGIFKISTIGLPSVFNNTAFRLIYYSAMIASFAYVSWSIRCAFRYYIKMDHSWSIAIATTAIAFLGMYVTANSWVWF